MVSLAGGNFIHDTGSTVIQTQFFEIALNDFICNGREINGHISIEKEGFELFTEIRQHFFSVRSGLF